MEAASTRSAAARGGRRKRALEVHDGEPAFVAGADGAYNATEMPKRLNCGHAAGETYARIGAIVVVRIKIVLAAMIRGMKAEAAADAAAHPPAHPSVA